MPLGATSRTHVLPSRGNGSFSVLLKVPSSVCVSQSTPSFTSDAQRCVAPTGICFSRRMAYGTPLAARKPS